MRVSEHRDGAGDVDDGCRVISTLDMMRPGFGSFRPEGWPSRVTRSAILADIRCYGYPETQHGRAEQMRKKPGVPASALARHLGLSVGRIHKLAAESVIPRSAAGGL